MSACNAFTEHVWKPGECKNCFKPKNLHQLPPDPEKAPVSNSNIKTNAIHSNQHNKNTGNFRPPVAKKPTIAVKPTMVTIDGQGICGEITSQDLGENKPALVGWNQNITLLKKKPLNNNNNEEEEEEEVESYNNIHRSFGNDDTNKAPSNNNGLTDVLKEIAGLDHSTFLTRNEINSREVFLGRINTSYKKSLERKIPPSCLMGGTKSQNKHVVLSGTTAVISSEGGRFCYPEFSSGDESEDDLFFGSIHDDHESWDESDEELLAMEIRMRGQPRFANFRANTLSPVRFCVDKKWNTVPLRLKSLQRFCAVDYDDSYDEILNGYGDEPVILFGPEGMQSMVSSDSMSPDSSLTEESHSGTASSSSQKLCNGRMSPNSPKGSRLMEGGDNRFSDDQQVKVSIKSTQNATQIVETHKAVLAIRLEEKDSKTAIPSDKQEWKSSLTMPVQTTTNLVPMEEQAKPYRVVNMEQPVCKPYTIVDVSAAMTHESIESRAKKLDTRYILSNPNSPDALSTNAMSHSVSCGQVTPNLKKSNTARYQEVWTSSTSPRQKIPKVELTANVPVPSVPVRKNIHKSAPTSPTSTNISTKTIPVKSPNLSEIKFNSYNNAGMPPFPIIIHDEPTYARCSKNAIKVPIVINPNAYDNLAIYKSFLGTNGNLSVKDKTTSIISHTYEEIETGSPASENTPKKSAELPQGKSSGNNTERRLTSVAQKVQEFNSCLGKGQTSPKTSCRGCPSKVQRTFQDSFTEVEDGQEIPSDGRENACAVLSQIVASIQPPPAPPEAPQTGPKSCGVEELYSLPPDAEPDKTTPVRPNALFSVQSHPNAEGNKSTEVTSKEIPSKSPVVQPSKPMASPKAEQAPPFPPPRSTSSPYHASKVLQKHFGNWSKPLSPARSTEAESVLHSEGRRAVDAKPKRWISFKSFFRRRKPEEEEEEREREKGKLVGLDGTVIHMLPPPPVERHNWFSESRTDSSEKPSVVFMFTCDQAKLETKPNQTKTGVEPAIEVTTAERGETGKQPETLAENLKSHSSSPQLPKEILSQVPDEKTKTVQNASPPIPTSAFEQQDMDSPAFRTPEILRLEDEREEMSDSSDVSACSATYSNLGQSRAAMMPPKHPRQLKGALEDAIAFGGISDPEISAILSPTPPPLPKKTILRAHTEPLPKDLQKQAVENSLCVMANPTYDIDTNWEGSSICSSVSSEFKAVDNESGDSLGRPPDQGLPVSPSTNLAALSIKKCGSGSMESVSVRPVSHSKPSKAAQKPQQQALYRGIENREAVVSKIRSLHADSLKKLSVRCEDLFMAGQKDQLRFGVDSWSDFRLTSDKPCCEAGDTVYYPASYAKDSLNHYAVKICKSRAKESQQYYHSLAIRQSLAIHFNIQQDCGHFLADVPVRLLPWEDPNSPEEEEEEVEQKSEESLSAMDLSQDSPGLQSTISKQRSRVVVITREVPYLSVADFVQNSVDHHSRCPDLYERQVCLLLLQLCSGLEHLKPYHITHCDLRLENLLLVGCRPGKSLLNHDSAELNSSAASPTRLLVSNFSQAKQKSHMVDPEILKDQSRLAPEIITAMQYKKCDEFQTGILIYEMLHLPNPFDENPELKEKEYTWADLPQIPRRSLYSLGLQKLAACLLNPNPSERILISEAKGVLQCLLWGPREDLFQSLGASAKPSQREAVLQNWLDIKRTLLMIKFAERSLDKECQVGLEDWLCCQYLAFATIDSLSRIVKITRQH
ncbi:inactive tyrosine-protein kinase PEAK1 isoform 2-T3 [Vipera latastei]